MDKKRYIIVSIIVSALFTVLEGAVLMIDRGISSTAAMGLALLFVLQAVILCIVFQKTVMHNISRIYSADRTSTRTEEKDHEKDHEKEKTDVSLDTIITEVNEDVAKWAKDRTHEIAILKANDKYRKEFLGNVSHELKTPLFNIQGYINTLIDNGLEDQDINMKYLDRAEKNVARLIKIVEDLGTISKFESGALKLIIENFDIKKSIEDVIEFYEIKAKTRNITLEMSSAPAGPAMCKGDKEKIYEVLSNLVVNSINYGKENGKTTLGVFDIGKKWLIEIQDNGIGIEESKLQRVFERFYRVDKSRSSQTGGTGLGLSIVKHIIEAHGELITVRSKINEGTTFSFTLIKSE
ncbi:MAG: sensor histidine kinase [Bacteroidales bacterium]|nr:sensor histidine kinase [Bacteroidales bacterium]MBR4213934.1 sensor histidine kinase [Bacteroidales bacterium]